MISSIAQTPSIPAPLPAPTSAPVATDLKDRFQQIDGFIASTHELVQKDATMAPVLKGIATQGKEAFRKELLATSTIPAMADDCRKAAFQALAGGLMAGALDGVVAFTAQQAPAPSTPSTPAPVQPAAAQPAPPATASLTPGDIGDQIREDLDRLMQDLGRAAEQAKDKLVALGPKALQWTAIGQKRLAGVLIDQTSRFADHPNTPVVAYQASMAALFALGYGIAVNDAALMILAGQSPRA